MPKTLDKRFQVWYYLYMAMTTDIKRADLYVGKEVLWTGGDGESYIAEVIDIRDDGFTIAFNWRPTEWKPLERIEQELPMFCLVR